VASGFTHHHHLRLRASAGRMQFPCDPSAWNIAPMAYYSWSRGAHR
jgi:hypothetical protein